MGKIEIKSPNSDKIWELWKKNNAGNKKFQKGYAVKGAEFDAGKISAAEYVQSIDKGAIIFYIMSSQSGKSSEKGTGAKKKAGKMNKIIFFDFKSNNIEKKDWKYDNRVPFFNTLTLVQCPKCKGAGGSKCGVCAGTGAVRCGDCKEGYIQCGACNGTGNSEIILNVMDESGNKNKVGKSLQCNNCFGFKRIICDKCGGTTKRFCQSCMGSGQKLCSECDGYGYLFNYQILPVPFKASSSYNIVLLSSAKLPKNIESEIKSDLEKSLPNIGKIEIDSDKRLNKKNINANLGYLDKNIWRIVKSTLKDIESCSKSDSDMIHFPIYLIPMITLHCITGKRKSYEIFALGTEDKFRIFGEI